MTYVHVLIMKCICSDRLSPPKPTDLSVTLCRSPVTDMGVAIVAWQPGRTYYEAYRNQTYYLAVFRNPDTMPMSRHIEIVGVSCIPYQYAL